MPVKKLLLAFVTIAAVKVWEAVWGTARSPAKRKDEPSQNKLCLWSLKCLCAPVCVSPQRYRLPVTHWAAASHWAPPGMVWCDALQVRARVCTFVRVCVCACVFYVCAGQLQYTSSFLQISRVVYEHKLAKNPPSQSCGRHQLEGKFHSAAPNCPSSLWAASLIGADGETLYLVHNLCLIRADNSTVLC